MSKSKCPLLPPPAGTKYCNLSLKITISVPDHSISAKYSEWSGTSNLTVGTGVVTGIGTGMATDTFISSR